MKKLASAVLAFVCAAGAATAGPREDAAATAALAWAQLVDNGHYGESWDQSASYFQSRVGKSDWADMAQKARAPFGGVKSRQLVSARYSTSLPGAPDGQYVVVQFDTQFEHKQHGVETITPMLEGAAWRVSGYYVK